jgi:hypothetical protein
LINLSCDDESFLRHRLIDEFHHEEGQRHAKRLQVEHGSNAADFDNLVAEVIPDPFEQEAREKREREKGPGERKGAITDNADDLSDDAAMKRTPLYYDTA